MTEWLTPSGGRIFYDYDTLNTLADKSYSSANELGNDRLVRMVYYSMGQRISMEDITGESTYTYDSFGRLKTAANGSGKTVEYYYDEADNLQGILYPDGYAVLYEYDKNNNITKLTDRDGRETVYGYDLLNRLTKVVRPDGSQSEYTYNARNQVLEAKNTCVCGFLTSDYQYTYNDGPCPHGIDRDTRPEPEPTYKELRKKASRLYRTCMLYWEMLIANDLREEASEYVREHIDEELPFNPIEWDIAQ